MSPSFFAVPAPHQAFEDPLAYLPCSTILEYRRGQIVYDRDQPSTSIFLVLSGKVKASASTHNGTQFVMEIYQEDEFFGEGAFLGLMDREETTVAIENAKLMSWTASEIEELAVQRPKLAIAMVQLLVQRSQALIDRIESFSIDNIQRRLARALIRFSERFGARMDGGPTQIIPFTHELLSQYVGTSREIVTHYMNSFRREGYLQYSRKGISLHEDALRDWLRQSA